MTKAGAFNNMPQLEELYLRGNKLTEIAAGVFPSSLTLLSIRENPSGQQNKVFSLTRDTLANLSNLSYLDMKYLRLNSVLSDELDDLVNLQILQMRNTGLRDLVGPVFRNLANLVVLDLGENQEMVSLSSNFSVGLENLEMLFLDHCSIDFPPFQIDSDRNPDENFDGPFSHLSGLSYLVIHNNKISSLDPRLMANLTGLELLYMSDNFLNTWHRGTTASFKPYETAVVASKNLLSILPNETYEEFAQLLYIDLSFNAFTCNCQAVDLKRLAVGNLSADGQTWTNVTIDYWDTPNAYLCTENGGMREIQSLTSQEFGCDKVAVPTDPPSRDDNNNNNMQTTVLVSGSVAGFVLLVVITAGTVYYKRKTGQTFRHRKKAAAAMIRGRAEENFEYDAFISFNEQDRAWVYAHLVPNLELEHSKVSSLDPSQGKHLKSFFPIQFD